jgi:ankyrin repeat protein
MGKGRDNLAYNLVLRGNRARLRQLLRKHRELKLSHSAMLVFASIWHNRGMLRWLLAQGVDPDCRMGKQANTPLMQASSDGDDWAIEILLEFGANPNALNEQQENPLGFATSWEQLDSIKLLVAAGADINDTVDSGPLRTQLDCAELSSWQSGADLLRSLGGKRYIELEERFEEAEQSHAPKPPPVHHKL